MKVACVTVTYNGSASTIRLLRSLEHQRDPDPDLDLVVVVVDNGSSSRERSDLRAFAERSPLALEVVESPENLGFSGGNNLAITTACAGDPDWIVLLNNDTEVDADFLAGLRSELSGREGLVGLPLIEDGTIVRAGRRRWLALTMSPLADPDDAPDSYAVGGAFAIDRRSWDRVGPLDEAYFLYFEDADYTERARRAGVPVRFAERPVIEHAGSVSARKLGSPLLARYHARNAVRFNGRNGPWWVRLALGPWIAWVALKSAVRLLVGPDRRRARGVLAGLADALGQRWGRIDERIPIGFDCESLEGRTWGMGREVSKLLQELAVEDEAARGFRITLYSKGPLPEWVDYDPRLCVNRPIARPSGGSERAHRSFSLYYFVLLPMAVRRDRQRAMYYPNYMLPFAAPRPSMVMITADIFQEVADRRLPFRQWILLRLFSVGWAKAKATAVMTISEASADRLAAEGVARERMVVNPLGVDPPREGAPLRSSSTFLWVGQAFPRRHLREAIRAFEQLGAGEGATFRIIGPDRYSPPLVASEVERINRSLGRRAIQWDEYVGNEELHAAYRSARAIVYVSDTEAFGLPPLEALTYGTPALLADTPVNREIYGSHAFFVALPITATGIASAMQRAIQDTEAQERIRSAGPSIASRYTWRAHADRLMQAMSELASQ